MLEGELDERPTRCWIHPSLKEELSNFHSVINNLAINKTGYPIQDGMPLASKLCAKILSKIREGLKKGDFNIYKEEEDSSLNIEIILGEEIGDIRNLNIRLHKIKGVKRNEIKIH